MFLSYHRVVLGLLTIIVMRILNIIFMKFVQMIQIIIYCYLLLKNIF